MSLFNSETAANELLQSPCSHSTTDNEPHEVSDQRPGKRLHEDSSEFNLEPGTEAFKKARKRRQNRESAARTRARKQSLTQSLSVKVDDLSRTNESLQIEIRTLRIANEIMQRDLDYYRDLAMGKEREI